jgi:response regulator NasT
MTNQIILAEDEPITRMDISEILAASGYHVAGAASNGLEVVEFCRLHRPDLVIMDIKMPKLDGIQAAKIIIREKLADAVVMLTAYSGMEFVNKVKEIGAIGYIVKPIEERNLIPQIEIAISKGKEIKTMRHEMVKTKEKIKDTKTIHQAKELLMDRYSMKENDAYRKIRKISMDRRCSILETSIQLLKRYGDAD